MKSQTEELEAQLRWEKEKRKKLENWLIVLVPIALFFIAKALGVDTQ